MKVTGNIKEVGAWSRVFVERAFVFRDAGPVAGWAIGVIAPSLERHCPPSRVVYHYAATRHEAARHARNVRAATLAARDAANHVVEPTLPPGPVRSLRAACAIAIARACGAPA